MASDSVSEAVTIRSRMIEVGLWDAADQRDPSKSIEAAWQVVEHMQAEGFSWTAYQSDSKDGWCLSEFTCPYGPCEKHGNPITQAHGSGGVKGETMPLAICRAALAAVEASQ